MKYWTKHGSLFQHRAHIIISLVDALAHLQWVGIFLFFFFLIVIILTQQLYFSLLCQGSGKNHTHTYKNSNITILGISLTGLFSVTVSILIDIILLSFKRTLPVAGITICVLQMEKLRLLYVQTRLYGEWNHLWRHAKQKVITPVRQCPDFILISPNLEPKFLYH